MSTREENANTSDWARTPSAMFAAGLLGVLSVLTIAIALSRDFQRDALAPSMALVSGQQQGEVVTAQPTMPTPMRAVRLIDINRADLAELDLLPGIGPALGQRIIEYRRQHGPFQTVESIQGVSGIGPRTLEKLRPLITLGDGDGYTTGN